MDAFEKLMKLNLKGQQERELVHVTVHCCLLEKSYNQFYASLICQFCHSDKRFRV